MVGLKLVYSVLQDIENLNQYFCEKEEELVIMLQHLDEQMKAAQTPEQLQLCHVGYIHLHGACSYKPV